VPRFDEQGNVRRGSEIMVIVEAEGKRVAALVDELLGQHQVVVKNLESNYRRVPDVSGATILGDGRVALIIDVGGLVKRARH
jgi:two-component system chemotaxis sensor kinase CheA